MQSNFFYISPLYRKYYINIKFIRLLQYKERWENNSPPSHTYKNNLFYLGLYAVGTVILAGRLRNSESRSLANARRYFLIDDTISCVS